MLPRPMLRVPNLYTQLPLCFVFLKRYSPPPSWCWPGPRERTWAVVSRFSLRDCLIVLYACLYVWSVIKGGRTRNVHGQKYEKASIFQGFCGRGWMGVEDV
jgi:hypothetical protein